MLGSGTKGDGRGEEEWKGETQNKGENSRGQEVSIVLTSDLAREVLCCQVVLVPLGALRRELLGLLSQELEGVGLVDAAALGGGDAVTDPLPELGAGDLGGGGVLHEVVDGDAADAAEPALHVADADVQVLADTVLGDLAGDVHVQEVVAGDVDILAAHEHLVGCGHVLVEDLGRDGGERRVGDPGAVVAGGDLAQLVGIDALHGAVIGGLVILDGDLGGHTTHGVDLAAVAGLDEQLDVGVHERYGHGDGGTVRQHEVGVLAELLDDAEDVVPTATIEAGRVVAQLVDDLVHLEGGEDGLDQHGAADGASRDGQYVLGQVEDVVPQARLQMGLHLGQVEVGAEATRYQLLGVVPEVQAEVEQAAGDGLAVDSEVLFLQVPATRPQDERGQRAVSSQFVLLGALLKVNLPTDGVVEVDLAVDHVVPGRRA